MFGWVIGSLKKKTDDASEGEEVFEVSPLDKRTGRKGYVVNIQPIKQETAEDVLRDMTNWLECEPEIDIKLASYIERAKKVLNQKGEI